MKTAKLVLSIIALCLVFVIMFQSCAAGVVNSLSEESDASGSVGVIVAICYLVGGIVGICTRKSRGGSITAGCFFIFAGLLGIFAHGIFKDLQIWGFIALAFGIVFILCAGKKKSKEKENTPE